MFLHFFWALLLLVVGTAQGLKLTEPKRMIHPGRRFFYIMLYLIISNTVIIGSSCAADLVAHRINPDVCIFGVANCVFTLLYYFAAANSFLYILDIKASGAVYPRLLNLQNSLPWLFYPALALAFIIPFNFYLTNKAFLQIEAEHLNSKNLWFIVAYTGGNLIAFGLQGFFPYIQPQRVLKALLYMIVFVACGYQFSTFISLNFIFNHNVILRYSSCLTITFMGFNALYLIIKTYTE